MIAWKSYSCRSAFIGSTLAARLAGIHVASSHGTQYTRRFEYRLSRRFSRLKLTVGGWWPHTSSVGIGSSAGYAAPMRFRDEGRGARQGRFNSGFGPTSV